MGDAGREQAECGHLFLVQHMCLRFLQFTRPLGNAGFELSAMLFQLLIQLAQVIADAL